MKCKNTVGGCKGKKNRRRKTQKQTGTKNEEIKNPQESQTREPCERKQVLLSLSFLSFFQNPLSLSLFLLTFPDHVTPVVTSDCALQRNPYCEEAGGQETPSPAGVGGLHRETRIDTSLQNACPIVANTKLRKNDCDG